MQKSLKFFPNLISQLFVAVQEINYPSCFIVYYEIKQRRNYSVDHTANPAAPEPIRRVSVRAFERSPVQQDFQQNNIKVSYSCIDNLQTIIKKHIRKILETSNTPSTENNCNCRGKNDSLLKNNCLTSSVVHNANVTTESDTIGKNYIGLTERTFIIISNVTRNTNFLFGTETTQTARNYQNISGH